MTNAQYLLANSILRYSPDELAPIGSHIVIVVLQFPDQLSYI